jgi:anti-anti-sigma factor
LELQDSVCDGWHTLVLSGEFDFAAADTLESVIRKICVPPTLGIVLDLTRLTFLDSTGLREVLLAARLCESQGCEFRVIPGRKGVQRVFEISGLIDRLQFDADGGLPTA